MDKTPSIAYLYIIVNMEEFRADHPVFTEESEAAQFLMSRFQSMPLGFDNLLGVSKYVVEWETTLISLDCNIRQSVTTHFEDYLKRKPEYTNIFTEGDNTVYRTLYFPLIGLPIYKN